MQFDQFQRDVSSFQIFRYRYGTVGRPVRTKQTKTHTTVVPVTVKLSHILIFRINHYYIYQNFFKWFSGLHENTQSWYSIFIASAVISKSKNLSNNGT